jgi:hypothetical protein
MIVLFHKHSTISQFNSSKVMIGAIELNRDEAILASQALQRNIGVDDAL